MTRVAVLEQEIDCELERSRRVAAASEPGCYMDNEFGLVAVGGAVALLVTGQVRSRFGMWVVRSWC